MTSIFLKITLIIAATLTSILSADTAGALDAACEPVLKSMEAHASAPAWQTKTDVPASKFKIEVMKAGGKYYTRYNQENWQESPVNADDEERKLLAQIRSNIIKVTQCKAEPDEQVESIDARAISYTIEMEGAPAVRAKLLVSKSDGRPLAQISDSTESYYYYKDLPAPR